MRQKIIFVLLSLVIFAAVIKNGVNAQKKTPGQPDLDAIANKIVNYALEVKPGEVVIITGNPGQMNLLTSLSVAVSKAGGQPTVEVNIPEANKRAIMEMPIEYLRMTPTYPLVQAGATDCFINIGSVQDPKLFADVPEERLAAARQAFMPISNAINRIRFRSVGLGQTGGIPTQVYAESKGADYEEMLAMFWKSVDADYDEMLQTGQTVSGLLKPGSKVKITSKAGTDLTFVLSEIPARINCGRSSENTSASGPAQVWLPAGEAYACVDPTSATGIIVVPHMTFRGKSVTNLKLTFANGRIANLQADKNGKMIQNFLDESTGHKDVLSVLDLGINPSSRPLKGSHHYSWEMSGMLTAYIGNNAWAGGNVVSDGGMPFHLSNSILSVDGKTVVNDGQLVVGAMAKK